MCEQEDPNMKVTYYRRTDEQDKALGLYAANAMEEGGAAALMEGGSEQGVPRYQQMAALRGLWPTPGRCD